jgi:hypothetical protein
MNKSNTKAYIRAYKCYFSLGNLEVNYILIKETIESKRKPGMCSRTWREFKS